MRHIVEVNMTLYRATDALQLDKLNFNLDPNVSQLKTIVRTNRTKYKTK